MSRTRRRVVTGAGAAVAAGLVLDQMASRRRDPSHEGEQLGSLRGTLRTIRADDGLLLHGEIDEVAPYGSVASHADQATVVFVHGFSLTLDCWHFQRAAFRGKRRMVFYDQRSHGRSERSTLENATIDQLGRDLRAVIDQLAPDEKVVLVGHSMGGMSIVALAEHYPELFGDRVVGIALISTTAGGTRTHKMLSRFIPDAIGRRAVERALILASQRERVLELARQGSSPFSQFVVKEFAFGDEPVPSSYAAFVDRMIASHPLKVLVEFIPEFDALDKFHVVKAFERIPCWIMCGTKDKLTSIGHSRKLHAHIDGSHLVEFSGGGHMPILEFRHRVNENLDHLFAEADEFVAASAEGPAEGVS